jgi:hypothetical protein
MNECMMAVCRSLEVVAIKIFASHGWRSNAKLEGARFVDVLFPKMFTIDDCLFSICKAVCKKLQKAGIFCFHNKKKDRPRALVQDRRL